jgi:hypothetical protein
VSKDAASLKNAAASVSRGEASLNNADEWASSNAGELASKNAVAGSRPPPAAADSKAGPARGKDNPAPTWAEAAPPVGALAEAAEHPAAVPANADTADIGRQAGAGGPPAAVPAITTDERWALALRAPLRLLRGLVSENNYAITVTVHSILALCSPSIQRGRHQFSALSP